MYFNLFYAALPLLFSLLLIKKTNDINKAMLYSTFLGFILCSVKKSLEPLLAHEGFPSASFLFSAAGMSVAQTVLAGFHLLKNIVIDKVPLAAAVFVLFFMVKLICGSDILKYVNMAADLAVTTRGRFLAVFLGLSLVFSIDDYLCCVGVGTVMAAAAAARGITREKTAYLICLLSIGLCTLVPYSSWMPVIRSAIGGAVPPDAVISMNLAAVFSILIVVAEILTGGSSAKAGCLKKRTALSLPIKAGKAFGILIAGFVVTAAVLNIVNLCTDGTWAIAAAGAAGCIVLIVTGVPSALVGMKNLPSGIQEAFMDTVTLFRTLFLIWMLKDICIEMLGLNTFLMEVMGSAVFPPIMLPAVIYLVSSGFAYITGTSFGAFSLFIPVAVNLFGKSNGCLSVLAASAALGGSLQSVNRPGSDVIRLTSGVLGCDEKKLMEIQKKGALRSIPSLFISFLIMGVCADHGMAVMISAGTAPLLVHTVVHHLRHRELSAAPRRTMSGSHTYGGIPYKPKHHTFYQKYKDLNAWYEAILLSMRRKALMLQPVNFI